MRLTWIAVLIGLICARAHAQNTCISFPAGFVPFSSISYVTAADSSGDHLVVGIPAGALASINANIPLPAFTNQTFCDAQVQLAPGQFYPNVYVPTSAELNGNFSAFTGLLVNPANNQPYPNGVIPSGQLGAVFAWRVGAAKTASGPTNWSLTGPMTEPRGIADAQVLLPSGKVLVLGSNADNGADLFDPTTGTFTSAGHTIAAHGSEVMAILLNNGLVLLEGGLYAASVAELYDPVAGTFTLTGSPNQPHGFYQTAALLNDGRVLVVGGQAGDSNSGATTNAGAEIYDPATGKFTETGPMEINRSNHTETVLLDGRVLVAGGSPPYTLYPTGVPAYDSAEIFDPTTGTFSVAFGRMTTPRGNFFAVRLANGKVLLGGGYGPPSVQTTELFDPSTNTFAFAADLIVPTALNAAVLLPSGEALIAGGYPNYPTGTNAAQLYEPVAGNIIATGSMAFQRGNISGTLLLDGRVLVTGGEPNCCTSGLFSAEVYTPTTTGLVTSQTGLTFRVAQGTSGIFVQQVAVLSTTATIPWTVSTHIYQGGNWLIVTPSSGDSVPGGTPTTLTIAANPSGLAAQDYYGAVTLTPTDGIHPPITIAVVLSIVPAGTAAPPAVTPSGLLFLGTAGATTLASQSFTISNLTSTPITLSGAGSTTPKWFSFTPANATIGGAQSGSITVTPNITGLTAGVYNGSITLTFGDGSTQTVALLLVLSAAPTTPNVRPHTTAPAATCTPSKLLPVFTTIGSGFTAPAAWATPIIIDVVDDCGNAFNTGSVIVSFTDGDPPINLLSTGNGNWAGTWVPVITKSGVTVRADAQSLPLTGTVQVTGAVSTNSGVPVVSAGGVVSSADFASAPALGLLVSIFGSGLADAPASAAFPLPQQLGTTSVLLSGGEQLPLLYAADDIINVQIPYNAAINSTQQLVVQHGNAISVPVPIAVFTASPSILSANGTGSGQGHVYVIGPGGVETQANQNTPATAGNPLVIYCVGLGAVTPGINAGAVVPYAPLSNTNAPVTVTFGNQTVPAGFAGLTPGLAGLYQVNVNVPPGVTPGNQVPVMISVAGKSSSSSIYMAIH